MRTSTQQLRPHTALQGTIGRPCRTQRLRVMIANGDGSSGWRERDRRLQIGEVAVEGTGEAVGPKLWWRYVLQALQGYASALR